MKLIWLCICGHPKEKHKGFSGPNSIGQWSHDECTQDSKSYGPYRLGGCGCHQYKRKFLPQIKYN